MRAPGAKAFKFKLAIVNGVGIVGVAMPSFALAAKQKKRDSIVISGWSKSKRFAMPVNDMLHTC